MYCPREYFNCGNIELKLFSTSNTHYNTRYEDTELAHSRLCLGIHFHNFLTTYFKNGKLKCF